MRGLGGTYTWSDPALDAARLACGHQCLWRDVCHVWGRIQLLGLLRLSATGLAANRGDISLVFSIAVSLYFLVGAVSGPLADRFGARSTCLFGVLVGGSGLIFAAAANALWQVYLGFGVGLGLGIGFSFVPSIAAVQRWFAAASRQASPYRA